MVQDRGNIKWSTLMLPEHAELLKELWAEDKKAVKPILDPQEMESINRQLLQAFEHQCTVTIYIYENRTENNYSGTVKRMDKERECLILKIKHNREREIPFQSIIRVIIN